MSERGLKIDGLFSYLYVTAASFIFSSLFPTFSSFIHTMAAPTTETSSVQDRSLDSTKTAGAQLGALEEDDEFEEFAAEGMSNEQQW